MNNNEMFENRNVPWNGIGNSVNHASKMVTVLEDAGLDYKVLSMPIFNEKGRPISGFMANTRTDNESVLGIVSERYKIVQNHEAFDFIDELVPDGLMFDKAGIINDGRKVWITAKLPEREIAGDVTIPYLVFINTHDGKGSLRVAITPVRVMCQNTLNLALRMADRAWSLQHRGDMEGKLQSAKETILNTEKYMGELKAESDLLIHKAISRNEWKDIVTELLPMPDDLTSRQAENVEFSRKQLNERYMFAPDLTNVRDTKWGALLAVSDFATHTEPMRRTSTFKEKLFENTVNGNDLIDEAFDLIKRI